MNTTKYTTLLTYIEYTKRSHDCDPTLNKTSMEENYVLVNTRLTNGLRSLKENTRTLQREHAAVWNYTTQSTSSSKQRPPSVSVVSSLKHKISKSEYKDVLSKTYIRPTLLMLKFQGKGRWGFNAEVPFLTWLILYYEYQNEVRSVHESIYPSLQNNTPLWILPRLPTRKHAIALTLILAILKYPLKLSNNQVNISKQSITTDMNI